MSTNVKPEELNYDHYETEKYDQDIINSIPGHEELHQNIDTFVERNYSGQRINGLELGVGTGLTALRILKKIPQADYTAIDFSKTMLEGARKRLVGYKVIFEQGDYSQIILPKQKDLVVSVLGIHHQETSEDKKKLFQKIYLSLSEGGTFLFGDLVTYKDQKWAALNEAKHYHHLVEKVKDEKSLQEWAFHHKFLNKLAPLEDQVEWLKEIGFSKVEVLFTKYNTMLLYAKK